MQDYLQSAIDIAKAQASVRVMNEHEVISYIKKISKDIRATYNVEVSTEIDENQVTLNPKNSVKENKVTCLECGKTFRMLTKRHLAKHGMDKEEYLEKWGLKKKTSLTCKSLHRKRRKKMNEMKLWEKRKNASNKKEILDNSLIIYS